MVPFWEVADRAINSGRLKKVKDFDFNLFNTVTRLVKEFGVKYDSKVPIPADDELADRIFEAGIKLYAEVGTYCFDTERVIQFTEPEIRQSLAELRQMPAEVEIGAGLEKRRLYARKIGDPRKPLVVGGFVESNPKEGRDFVQMYKSVAQEKIIDGIYYGPPPASIEGKKWVLNSPLDCHAAISATGWMREALRSVGRPGLHLLDASPSAIGAISTCDPEHGLRKTDAMTFPTISELKVNFEALNKVAYCQNYGYLKNPFWTSITGGFAGGPEGCAVVNVASALNAIMVYQVAGAGYVCNAGLMQNPPINTIRPTVWVRNVSTQALVRNTPLIVGGGGLTAAGPGTEQQLWEIAVLGIHVACVGGHIFHGCRKAVMVKPNQGTGMESRWEGEAARAGCALRREDANELIDFMIRKYESTVKPDAAPPGFSFDELYDPESVQVKPEYFGLYSKVKTELEDKGLVFD
ncbi:MAG TPA: monomethylamine:corrinoid methyltransferase [Candidatus Sulfotelmatobacter sp.]|nr:monomethylamine:corrinoid methyltransferase [Candidatus Sulfotelmatobacter sp.]